MYQKKWVNERKETAAPSGTQTDEHKDISKTSKKVLPRENHDNEDKKHYVLVYNVPDNYSSR